MKKIMVFILLILSVSIFAQEKRLALVVGNSSYENAGVLKNPVNDALAMKKVLEQVGFEVYEYFNLNQSDMRRAIDGFGLSLKDYDVGLFFYAGHGIQAKGNNYLVPVDANLLSENDVEYNCINAGRILGKMEDASNNTNIIILDACRNNPFERSWTRSTHGSGLASMDAPIGSILAFATAPGHTASDGSGLNGLYTSALIKSISEPSLSIEDVFKQVRVRVINESSGNQIPWESTSLTGDFYFKSSIQGTGNLSTNDEYKEKSSKSHASNYLIENKDYLDVKLEPYDLRRINKHSFVSNSSRVELFWVLTCSKIIYDGKGVLNPQKSLINIKKNIPKEESFYVVTKFQNGADKKYNFQGAILQLRDNKGKIISDHIIEGHSLLPAVGWIKVEANSLFPGIYTIHSFLFESISDIIPEGEFHKIERIRIL